MADAIGRKLHAVRLEPERKLQGFGRHLKHHGRRVETDLHARPLELDARGLEQTRALDGVQGSRGVNVLCGAGTRPAREQPKRDAEGFADARRSA